MFTFPFLQMYLLLLLGHLLMKCLLDSLLLQLHSHTLQLALMLTLNLCLEINLQMLL
uniref:Alternative protein PICALM n=1 Tax=Homo sapiens TaxID=9606 RepID=L8ECD8_HUMAN|nr:alternative protein PICALM [Homo sapiens]